MTSHAFPSAYKRSNIVFLLVFAQVATAVLTSCYNSSSISVLFQDTDQVSFSTLLVSLSLTTYHSLRLSYVDPCLIPGVLINTNCWIIDTVKVVHRVVIATSHAHQLHSSPPSQAPSCNFQRCRIESSFSRIAKGQLQPDFFTSTPLSLAPYCFGYLVDKLQKHTFYYKLTCTYFATRSIYLHTIFQHTLHLHMLHVQTQFTCSSSFTIQIYLERLKWTSDRLITNQPDPSFSLEFENETPHSIRIIHCFSEFLICVNSLKTQNIPSSKYSHLIQKQPTSLTLPHTSQTIPHYTNQYYQKFPSHDSRPPSLPTTPTFFIFCTLNKTPPPSLVQSQSNQWIKSQLTNYPHNLALIQLYDFKFLQIYQTAHHHYALQLSIYHLLTTPNYVYHYPPELCFQKINSTHHCPRQYILHKKTTVSTLTTMYLSQHNSAFPQSWSLDTHPHQFRYYSQKLTNYHIYHLHTHTFSTPNLIIKKSQKIRINYSQTSNPGIISHLQLNKPTFLHYCNHSAHYRNIRLCSKSSRNSLSCLLCNLIQHILHNIHSSILRILSKKIQISTIFIPSTQHHPYTFPSLTNIIKTPSTKILTYYQQHHAYAKLALSSNKS